MAISNERSELLGSQSPRRVAEEIPGISHERLEMLRDLARQLQVQHSELAALRNEWRSTAEAIDIEKRKIVKNARKIEQLTNAFVFISMALALIVAAFVLTKVF